MIKFKDLKLNTFILNALNELGYETPTPIQEKAIPLVLDEHDLLGIAQTGTGKTAAFCLPILNKLNQKKKRPQPKSPRALVLTPTRELAIQIFDNLKTYGKYLPQKYSVIFGGVGQHPQVQSLRQGVEVLVATPGRLLDLCQQGHLKLDQVEIFVLDEADRMLDMGFANDIKKVMVMLPNKRHNLFFSATMPSVIQRLANNILVEPKKVEITPPATTVARIHQEVMFVDKPQKIPLLQHLLKDSAFKKVLVFVGMKHVANRVAEKLSRAGITASAIHGNKAQGARQRAIEDFSKARLRVLVATDIASRGIDIDGISHVINYDLGNLAESYVHRIGRTARAGTEGVAITFVTAEEKINLVNVERTTKQKIKVMSDQPFHSKTAEMAAAVAAPKKAQGRGRPQSRGPKRGPSAGQSRNKKPYPKKR